MKLAIGFFLSFLSLSALAQVRPAITLGANLSTIQENNGQPDDAFKSKFGGNGGVLISVEYLHFLYFQLGAQFDQLGFRESGSNSQGEYTFKETLNYLKFPLLFVKPIKAGEGNFLLGAGPYFSIGIGGSWQNKQQSQFNNNQTSNGNVVFVKQVDNSNIQNIGADDDVWYKRDGGLSFLFGYRKDNMSITLRYNVGLQDINQKINIILPYGTGSVTSSVNPPEYYNRCLTLSLDIYLVQQ